MGIEYGLGNEVGEQSGTGGADGMSGKGADVCQRIQEIFARIFLGAGKVEGKRLLIFKRSINSPEYPCGIWIKLVPTRVLSHLPFVRYV